MTSKGFPGSLLNLRRRAVVAGIGGLAVGGAWSRSLLGAPTDATTAAEFGDVFRGAGAMRGTTHYEDWRQSVIWQRRKPRRFPDAIVQARSTADVVAAVNYARQHRLRLTTRCGGHSTSACFLRDNGLLLDVGQLGGIEVDPARKVASIGPGVIARELCERLRLHGLTFPTAHCGMVPMGGFLLGGGLGFNGNEWGTFSAFNIRSAEVVTADGQVRVASATENPGLFWALRGGGPGLFGVVTRFELQVFDRPAAIIGNTLSFGFSKVDSVFDALAQIAPDTPRNVEILSYVGAADPGLAAGLRPEDHGLAVHLHANAYVDAPAEAKRAVRPLLEHPIAGQAVARSLDQRYTIEELFFAEELTFGQRRWTGDNIFTNQVREVATVLKARMPARPTRDAQAVLLYKGSPTLPDAACSTVGDFYSSFYNLWDDPSEDRRVLDYMVELYKEMKPFGVGSNINEMNQEGRPEDIHQCFSPEAWQRLRALRTQWDPQGVFHDFFGAS